MPYIEKKDRPKWNFSPITIETVREEFEKGL